MQNNYVLDLRKHEFEHTEIAKLHIKLGFINSPVCKKYHKYINNMDINKKNINESNDIIKIKQYYTDTYPDLLFIHKNDFKDFLNYYNLKIIKAEKYTKDVNELDLHKINNAQKLKRGDEHDSYFNIIVNDKSGLNLVFGGTYIKQSDIINQFEKCKINYDKSKIKDEIEGNIFSILYRNNIYFQYDMYRPGNVTEYNFDGIYVLESNNILNIKIKNIFKKCNYKLPIYFRYCRDGVQLLNLSHK